MLGLPKWLPKEWKKLGICGAVGGFLNGLFGAGGGVLLVFMFRKLIKMEDKDCMSTALLVMPIFSFVSAIFYSQFIEVDTDFTMQLVIGGLLGGLVGGLIFVKLNPKILRKIFALFIIWAAYRAVFG